MAVDLGFAHQPLVESGDARNLSGVERTRERLAQPIRHLAGATPGQACDGEQALLPLGGGLRAKQPQVQSAGQTPVQLRVGGQGGEQLQAVRVEIVAQGLH